MFGIKPQVPISLRLGTLRNDNKFCNAKQNSFCEGLPPHKHENENLLPENVKKILKPDISLDLLQRENDFKKIYSSVYEKNLAHQERENRLRSKYNLAKPLKIGTQVLVDNNVIPKDRSIKLRTRREGPFKILRIITPVNYELQDVKNPVKIRVVPRYLLIPYYPKENILPHLVSSYIIENKMAALPNR